MVNIGIIGCGSFAGAHARRLSKMPNVRIAALCSRRESSIADLIERRLSDYQPSPNRYVRTEDMYVGEKLDAVVIVTPHVVHFEQAMEALDHGCHVLLEKPMTSSAVEAHELDARVRATGLTLEVCYNTAYTPAFHYIKGVVQSGEYGRLELVHGYICQDWLRLTGGSWRQTAEISGGGQALDSGAHIFNSMCWPLSSRPVSVFAMADNLGSEVDINSVACIRFAAGVLGTICVGGNSPQDGSHMSFVFSEGRIDVDGWRGGWVKGYKGLEKDPNTPQPGGEPNPDTHFIDVITEGAEPICTAQDGVVLAELMEAFYTSVIDGKPVEITN